jgi:hypothetical protein
MTQHRAETLSRLLRCTLDFRVGALTEVSRNVRHVRFDLVSGPITDIARGQLRAIRRHPDKKCEKS